MNTYESTSGFLGRIVAAAVFVLGCPAHAERALVTQSYNGAAFGRFLPDAGAGSIIHEYGMAVPTMYDQSVRDSTKDIDAGMIKFDYSTFSRRPDGTVSGGGALAGGFFLNDLVDVKKGFELHWIQKVSATRTGQNHWNLPATGGAKFPDATPASPVYAHESVPTFPQGMRPTLGFQDGPNRRFADGAQTWLGELALACIADQPGDDGSRQVRVIHSFLWGFELLPEGPFDVDDVLAETPGFWSNPTKNFVDTMNEYYDGMGGGGGDDGAGGTLPAVESEEYHFSQDDNCFRVIPEPATMMLLLLGALGALSRKRSGSA